MTETRLWTKPPVQEKVHIIFKLIMYYKTWTCSNQNIITYYGQSQCARHHSTLSYFCTSCHPFHVSVGILICACKAAEASWQQRGGLGHSGAAPESMLLFSLFSMTCLGNTKKLYYRGVVFSLI